MVAKASALDVVEAVCGAARAVGLHDPLEIGARACELLEELAAATPDGPLGVFFDAADDAELDRFFTLLDRRAGSMAEAPA
ncbi:MAG TPA: hypothetical protein VGL23_16515 [Chloroflexota bacterium]|jgi:hypothetical protein